MLDVVDINLAILLAVAAVWLAAGIVADGLPQARTAGALRRRTGWLLALTATGLAGTAAAAVRALGSPATTADQAVLGLALPAASATVVAALTVRRLSRLRTSAGAFAAAPGTPAPPALVAGAAHPMVALPVQVAGLVSLPAAVTATGLVPLTGPSATGPVLTAAVLAVATIGVRHALRHSRLTELAVTVRPRSARAADVLRV
jgi:hypothetical protein